MKWEARSTCLLCRPVMSRGLHLWNWSREGQITLLGGSNIIPNALGCPRSSAILFLCFLCVCLVCTHIQMNMYMCAHPYWNQKSMLVSFPIDSSFTLFRQVLSLNLRLRDWMDREPGVLSVSSYPVLGWQVSTAANSFYNGCQTSRLRPSRLWGKHLLSHIHNPCYFLILCFSINSGRIVS